MDLTEWALCVRQSHANALLRLRGLGAVRIGELGGLVWARGESRLNRDDGARDVLSRVPSGTFYEIVEDDRLRPVGRLLPTERLPVLPWIRLEEYLDVRAPGAALPGTFTPSARLSLVRSASERSGEELLVCSDDAFRIFLRHFPAHRLVGARFVVNELTSEVLVRGRPLPSLAGARYVLASGVATPLGLRWFPAVGASVVRAWLGLPDDALVLWRSDGSISEISETSFAEASRRAGRTL